MEKAEDAKATKASRRRLIEARGVVDLFRIEGQVLRVRLVSGPEFVFDKEAVCAAHLIWLTGSLKEKYQIEVVVADSPDAFQRLIIARRYRVDRKELSFEEAIEKTVEAQKEVLEALGME